MSLAGCAGGMGLDKVDADPSIITSGVPQDANTADATRLSDEATIRNAVSSADIEAAAATPLAWANADTGSRGTITGMVESKDNGRLCRSFTTTRESFDGIALYRGEACLMGGGGWRMPPLDPA
jgi:hypothetical protein